MIFNWTGNTMQIFIVFFFFFFFFVQELKDEVCLVMEVSEYICPILNMLVLCGMLFIILTPRLCVGQNGKCYLVW